MESEFRVNINARWKNLCGLGLMLALVLFSIGFCGIVYFDQDIWCPINKIASFEVPSNTHSWIDYIDYSDKDVLMGGYLFMDGESIATANYNVVLYDTVNQSYHKINTDVNNLGDLSSYFESEYEYDDGRFVARVKKSHLIPMRQYDVYILCENNDYNNMIPLGRSVQVEAK